MANKQVCSKVRASTRFGTWALGAALLALAPIATAGFLPAKAVSITSTVLHQERQLEVYLPEESAKEPLQHYDTLYVLDGDWNTKLVLDIVSFMRNQNFLPPIIVVGIPNRIDAKGNNSRDRDFTVDEYDDWPGSGGAADFLTFLKAELIPYVDKNFPTSSTRHLFGYSLGGLFAMYALATDPTLFNGYLVLDPAMWRDPLFLEKQLPGKLARVPTRGRTVFIAGRSGIAFSQMRLDTLQAELPAGSSPSLHWKVVAYDDETHGSLGLKGTYDGLKFAYYGYTSDAVNFAPAEGIVVKGSPIRLLVIGNRLHLRYTIDGSEPSEQSPEAGENGFSIDDPGLTRIKLISSLSTYDRSLALGLKLGAAIPPLPPSDHRVIDAKWRYAFYANDSAAKPGRKHLLLHGVAGDDLDLSKRPDKAMGGQIARELFVPEDGYYIFTVDADQPKLRLNGLSLIASDGQQERRSRSYLAPLRHGIYSLSLDFQKPTRDSELRLGIVRYDNEQPEWWKQQKPWLGLYCK